MNLITSAVAQTLTPVATAGGLSVWHVVAIGGAVLALAVAGWYYGIHKRGKDAEAGAAVDNTFERLANLLDRAHDLIAKQHEVIVSPPVQAAINATPPAAATPSGSPTAAQSAAPSIAVPPWER